MFAGVRSRPDSDNVWRLHRTEKFTGIRIIPLPVKHDYVFVHVLFTLDAFTVTVSELI